MSTTDLRPLWLCADDYGMTAGVSAAIRELIAHGRLNATSVMTGAPGFNAAEAAALDALNTPVKRAQTGLHVTLTGPFAPISAGFAPLANSAFLPLNEAMRDALLRRYARGDLTREIAAQFDAFRNAFGRAPDFVDGHQHAHLFPQIRDAFLAAVRDHAPGAWVRQCGRTVRLHRALANPKALVLDALSRAFRRRTKAFGIRTNPAFAGAYDFAAPVAFAQTFSGFLDGLPAGSLVMCHPGFPDEELRRLDPVTDQRRREYDYFMSDAFPHDMRMHGLTLAQTS
jgi:predicted glycoside hydrolase/deacetylase ChbG (UPF0249 family)